MIIIRILSFQSTPPWGRQQKHIKNSYYTDHFYMLFAQFLFIKRRYINNLSLKRNEYLVRRYILFYAYFPFAQNNKDFVLRYSSLHHDTSYDLSFLLRFERFLSTLAQYKSKPTVFSRNRNAEFLTSLNSLLRYPLSSSDVQTSGTIIHIPSYSSI